MRSDSTPSPNRRDRRLASRRTRRRPALTAGVLAVGVLATVALTGTAPVASAAPADDLSSATFRLASFSAPSEAAAPEAVAARAAVTAAGTVSDAATAVQNDIAASGLDIGRPASVDTTELTAATRRLTDAETLPATFLPELTDRVTAATSTVSERVAALRGALDAAVAEKQAEEAAEKARQEAEAAAQAKAEQEAAAASSSSASAPIVTSGGGSGDNSVGGAQATARGMLAGFGWGDDQFSCLVSLWNKESGWNVRAYNAGSGAYGIPQALPGSKMGSAGADWETNAATQISWGLGYISGRYGDPCGAWGHSQSTGWY
ncbi:MAG: lytic transglycosylase domain-containing protein [Microbacterium sp.]|uniref:aggregation-promoting factor C-terminal-like domain-containing protein n=1 Tax=unclassified Microbacterium TaxID=2609290 RepID=UPI000AC3DF81|nr:MULTISPECIES: lytic transglycosylase domain-containing protein [unclassified Microbacterium]MBN9210886.1 lytic transglycosylase domain-containing protein [Microbacterium sp.]